MRKNIPSCPRWNWRMMIGRTCDDSAWTIMQRKQVCFTHTARTAIYRACELAGLTGGGGVLAPSYHCGSEIDTLLKAGARVSFYQVDASAQINLADLADRIGPDTRAIYLTHYFGFAPPVDAVKSLCRHHGLALIEDRALSAFVDPSVAKEEVMGDLVIYCFKKTIPLPDGGALQISNEAMAHYPWAIRPSPRVTRTFGTARLVKQSLAIAARRLIRMHSKSPVSMGPESFMPCSYHYTYDMSNRGMSATTARMLRHVSVSNLVKRRRENFLQLQSRLATTPGASPSRLSHLSPGVCPLFYPVLVNDRAAVLTRLHQCGVGAIGFWSGYHPDIPLHEFPEARRLKNHLIGLPVHQDLDAQDMAYVASSFETVTGLS